MPTGADHGVSELAATASAVLFGPFRAPLDKDCFGRFFIDLDVIYVVVPKVIAAQVFTRMPLHVSPKGLIGRGLGVCAPENSAWVVRGVVSRRVRTVLRRVPRRESTAEIPSVTRPCQCRTRQPPYALH